MAPSMIMRLTLHGALLEMSALALVPGSSPSGGLHVGQTAPKASTHLYGSAGVSAPAVESHQTKASHLLSSMPALVLNGDFTPLSYAPLSLWSWQDAVKAVFLDRVTVVEAYDDVFVRSPTFEIQVPSVIALKQYVPRSKLKPAFTRRNLFLRDKYTCQYCGAASAVRDNRCDLTYDHVMPRSRGGPTDWGNVVASCSPCNNKKGDLSLKEAGKAYGMYLSSAPRAPTFHEIHSASRAELASKELLARAGARGTGATREGYHPTWRGYLY